MKAIPLRARDGSVRAYALVDELDYEVLWRSNWSLNSKGYARRRKPCHEYMHRAIGAMMLGRPLGREQVHHGKGGILDNRRSNLVVCADGGEHRRIYHSREGIGVCRHRQSGRWMAYLDLPGKKRRYLKTHETEAAALAVVEEARRAVA